MVWFELHATPQEPSPAPEPADVGGTVPTTAEVVLVELRNFPVLMHAAWQEHSSALLREFLLTGLTGDEMAALERHAAASEAMNILYEQVPEPELGDDPEAIMTTATEPGVSRERLVLSVPRHAVVAFDTLDAMLSEATDCAEAGGAPGAPDPARDRGHAPLAVP